MHNFMSLALMQSWQLGSTNARVPRPSWTYDDLKTALARRSGGMECCSQQPMIEGRWRLRVTVTRLQSFCMMTKLRQPPCRALLDLTAVLFLLTVTVTEIAK